MRRCLHSLLVGALVSVLSVDAVRACGHLRCRRICPPPCPVPMVVVPAAVEWDSCGSTVSVVLAAGDCCGSVVVAAAEDAGLPPVASVVAPPAAEPAPTPLAAVPELEAVEPASATEPAPSIAPADSGLTIPADEPEPVEPQTDAAGDDVAGAEASQDEKPVAAEEDSKESTPAEPPVVTPEPVPEPRPRNIFEEADAAVADDADSAPRADVAPGDDSSALPAAVDGVPAAEPPVDDPLIDDVPVIEPAAEDGSSVAPEDGAAVEPLRRWIDASASFAVVGRLVAVHGETVAIERADGRHVTVPIARLSHFDRDYVAVAGPRVAAGLGPQPHETASR